MWDRSRTSRIKLERPTWQSKALAAKPLKLNAVIALYLFENQVCIKKNSQLWQNQSTANF